MAKISISDVLKTRRRFRVMTLLACVALIFVLGQMIIINGGQKTKAAPGMRCAPNGDNCIISGNAGDTYEIPAAAEGKTLTIDGALTVNADTVKVWQNNTTHYECAPSWTPTRGGTTYVYDHLDGKTGTCWYAQHGTTTYRMFSGYYVYLCPTPDSFTSGGILYTATGHTDDPYLQQPKSCQYSYTTATTLLSKSATPVSHSKAAECGRLTVDTTPGATKNFVINPAQSADCDSKRTFTNLTLQNGATVSHTNLVRLADTDQDTADYGTTAATNDSLADNTLGSARWKKVDIEVKGALAIDSGSGINVNEKGYPTTDNVINDRGRGWGPAGGGDARSDCGGDGDNGNRGGGGGYGAPGIAGCGSGSWTGQAGFPPYGDRSISDDAQFEWGSAGGWGRYGRGGAGGGRVRLVVGTLSLADSFYYPISANGGDGTTDNPRNANWGGGGSGGSIKIIVSRYTGSGIQAYADGHKQAGSHLLETLRGTVNLVNFTYTSTTGPAILALGGFGYYNSVSPDYVGSGAGGRIYIERIAPAVTVSKQLINVERNGVIAEYNPYALQMGDIIKVQLDLSSFAGTVSVEDQYLKAVGAICTNDTTHPGYPNHGGTAGASSVLWTGISSTDSPLIYYCNVQKR